MDSQPTQNPNQYQPYQPNPGSPPAGLTPEQQKVRTYGKNLAIISVIYLAIPLISTVLAYQDIRDPSGFASVFFMGFALFILAQSLIPVAVGVLIGHGLMNFKKLAYNAFKVVGILLPIYALLTILPTITPGTLTHADPSLSSAIADIATRFYLLILATYVVYGLVLLRSKSVQALFDDKTTPPPQQ